MAQKMCEYIEMCAYFDNTTCEHWIGQRVADVVQAVVGHTTISSAVLVVTPSEDARNTVADCWPREYGDHDLGVRRGIRSESASADIEVMRSLPPGIGSILIESKRRGSLCKQMSFDAVVRYEVDDPYTNVPPPLMGPRWVTSVNTDKLNKPQGRAAMDVVVAWADACAAIPETMSGHCEIGSEADTVSGWIHVSKTAFRPWPKHRLYNHALWYESGIDQSQYVRGVYWGNFLSPSLAARADEGGMITKEFANLSLYEGDPKPQVVKTYPNGSMFIAVSDNPLDGSKRRTDEYQPECLKRMIWLHRAFMTAGLLP